MKDYFATHPKVENVVISIVIIILAIFEETLIEAEKFPSSFASEKMDFDTAKHNRLRRAENNGEHLLA